jgi:hypothetical protein
MTDTKKVKMQDLLVIKIGLSAECGTWNSNLEGTLIKITKFS